MNSQAFVVVVNIASGIHIEVQSQRALSWSLQVWWAMIFKEFVPLHAFLNGGARFHILWNDCQVLNTLKIFLANILIFRERHTWTLAKSGRIMQVGYMKSTSLWIKKSPPITHCCQPWRNSCLCDPRLKWWGSSIDAKSGEYWCKEKLNNVLDHKTGERRLITSCSSS